MFNKGFTYKGKPYSFKTVAENYQKVKRQLPGAIAVVGVNFFKDSFRRQGWLDKRTEPWAKRAANAKRNKGRAILISSGRLRNAIRIAEKSFPRTVIANNVPYAMAHNQGFKGMVTVKAHDRKLSRKQTVHSTQVFNIKTKEGRKSTVNVNTSTQHVRTHTRKMNLPQRQFMGNSAILTAKIEKTAELAVRKIFNF